MHEEGSTRPMPPVQLGLDDVEGRSWDGGPARTGVSQWAAMLVGLIGGLLVIGTVYLLVADTSADRPAAPPPSMSSEVNQPPSEPSESPPMSESDPTGAGTDTPASPEVTVPSESPSESAPWSPTPPTSAPVDPELPHPTAPGQLPTDPTQPEPPIDLPGLPGAPTLPNVFGGSYR